MTNTETIKAIDAEIMRQEADQIRLIQKLRMKGIE